VRSRAARQTRRWHAVVWELLGSILHAHALGDLRLRDDRMLQLAILTKATWYLQQQAVKA